MVKVLDFGLVKELTKFGSYELTAGMQIGGTPLYMAPERVTAPKHLDARVDVYSLGAMLYALARGNAQSYVEFFEHMSDFLYCAYDESTGDRFRRIFARHGVLGINATGKLAFQVRDSGDAGFIDNVFPLGSGWQVTDLEVAGDADSDGLPDLSVLAYRLSDSKVVIHTRTIDDDSLIGNVFLP